MNALARVWIYISPWNQRCYIHSTHEIDMLTFISLWIGQSEQTKEGRVAIASMQDVVRKQLHGWRHIMVRKHSCKSIITALDCLVMHLGGESGSLICQCLHSFSNSFISKSGSPEQWYSLRCICYIMRMLCYRFI